MHIRKFGVFLTSLGAAWVLTISAAPQANAQTVDATPQPVLNAQTTTGTTTANPDVLTAEPDRFTITPFIGPGFGGGLQSNALNLGVAAGYNFTTRVGVEGEFSYARQGSNNLVNTSSNTQTYSVNALYHVPLGRWLPYGTFGIGALHGSAEVTAPTGTNQLVSLSNSETDFSWNLGAGVKRSISDNVRFRGDLRFFNAGTLPNFWRVYGGLTFLLGQR
jgi:opacity protein-like surface antigen